MMKGKMEPFVVPTVVRAMPTMVNATKQTIKMPQMIMPQETTKGTKARGTTYDILIGKTTKGAKLKI